LGSGAHSGLGIEFNPRRVHMLALVPGWKDAGVLGLGVLGEVGYIAIGVRLAGNLGVVALRFKLRQTLPPATAIILLLGGF
jgi:hypothetical protein